MPDVELVDCPTCAGSALVALCGRTDAGSDGPCVLRASDSDNHICYGEGDVATGPAPAATCPTCCVCPCGSTGHDQTEAGTECPYCHVTMIPGKVFAHA